MTLRRAAIIVEFEIDDEAVNTTDIPAAVLASIATILKENNLEPFSPFGAFMTINQSHLHAIDRMRFTNCSVGG